MTRLPCAILHFTQVFALSNLSLPAESVKEEIWETGKMTEREMQDTVNDFLLGED